MQHINPDRVGSNPIYRALVDMGYSPETAIHILAENAPLLTNFWRTTTSTAGGRTGLYEAPRAEYSARGFPTSSATRREVPRSQRRLPATDRGRNMKGQGLVAGVPVIAIKEGCVFALELKADNGTATPRQIETMRAMERAGATVALATGLDAAIGKLEEWGLVRVMIPDLRQVIRDCRLAVCEAYYRSPHLAMEELARASLRLTAFVADGALSFPAAFDPLQGVAENLGLVGRWFGQDAVQEALAYGPSVYGDMRAAA